MYNDNFTTNVHFMFYDKLYIAQQIRMARKQNQLTQERLAEQIGISAKQLSRIEIGGYIPSLPTFLKLVKILNIDMQKFGIIDTKLPESVLDKFLKFVYALPDRELEYYYEILRTAHNNMDLIRKNS